MSYGTLETTFQSYYATVKRAGDIPDDYITLQVTIPDTYMATEADYDVVFQNFLDAVAASADFVVTSASKNFQAHQPVTPTTPTP